MAQGGHPSKVCKILIEFEKCIKKLCLAFHSFKYESYNCHRTIRDTYERFKGHYA